MLSYIKIKDLKTFNVYNKVDLQSFYNLKYLFTLL